MNDPFGEGLRYKFKDIPEAGQSVELTIDRPFLKDALEAADADLEQTKVSARLQLHKAREQVVVRGELSAVVALPCGLCLRTVAVPIKAPVQVTFVPDDSEEPATEDDPFSEDLERFDGQTIDVAPTLREQLILNLPMAPRCSDECRGLCPTCGQDLNRVDCGHARGAAADEAPVDPRLQALRDLKLK